MAIQDGRLGRAEPFSLSGSQAGKAGNGSHPAAHRSRRCVQHREHSDNGRRRQDKRDWDSEGDGNARGINPPDILRAGTCDRRARNGTRTAARVRRSTRTGQVPVHQARPAGLFHRSPAGDHAADRRDVDHSGQYRDRRDCHGVSISTGLTPFPDRRDQTRMTLTVLEAHDVHKAYIGGDGNVLHVLNGVDLSVQRGEMIAVVGASGAGKSTLMHVLGALDKPTRGYVVIGGEPVHGRNETELGELRNRTVGFVFQFHHLLREFSALENVMMPLRIAGRPEEMARSRAAELLARVGLSARMTHRPAELSGGEQQRTAVARALAMDPQVVLADEPSGNLDRSNAEMLHELLSEVVNDLEIGMVVVTHSRSLAARASKVLLLEGGRLSRTEVDEVVV